MTGLMVLIFVSLFGVSMIAISIGARVLESQTRKRMAATLAVAADRPVPAETSGILIRKSSAKAALQQALEKTDIAARIEKVIQQGGLDWNWSKLAGLTFMCVVVGVLIGLKVKILLSPLASSVALAILLGSAPGMYLSRARNKRLAEFEKQFPEALDFLARALRAGHAFTTTLEMLAQESPEPLRGEFRKVFNEQKLGEAVSIVLGHLGDRIPLVDVRFFVAAVLMQRETGGNLAEILTKLAQVIRERFRLRGQVRAVSAHGRMTATVLTLMPIALTCFLTAVSPTYLAIMFEERMGRYMFAGAILGIFAGYLVMKRIVNIKV